MFVLSSLIRASVLILLFLFVRAWLLYRLPKKLLLLMWAVVLLRLLIPYTPTIALGVSLPNAEQLLYPLLPLIGRPTGSASTIQLVTYHPLPPLFGALWLAGSLLLALYFIGNHIRSRRVYRYAHPLHTRLVDQWMQQNGLKRKIRVLQCSGISGALTYGLIRPVILLPAAMAMDNEDMLCLVLSHEREHIRHFDVLWKWAAALALCLFWYNPLVWAMYVQLNRDVELHCDECVLRARGSSAQGKKSYASALLQLAQSHGNLRPMANQFGAGCLHQRIYSILRFRRARSPLSCAVTLGIIALALWSFVTVVTASCGIGNVFPL